jgi:hypothetical protein
MSDIDKIVSAIQNVINDVTLKNLTPTWSDDSISYASRMGASKQSVDLMRLLASVHPKLSNAFIQFGDSAGEINPAILAKWLAQRAEVIGAKEAYCAVQSLEANDGVVAYNVTLIRGLDFSGCIDFGEKIQLTDYSNLPDSIKQNIANKIDSSRSDFNPPYTYLFQPFCSNLLKIDNGNDVMTITNKRAYIEYELLIVNFLSLFSVRYAPTVDRHWCVLEDGTPMSGILDNRCRTYAEIIPPSIVESWQGINSNEVKELFNQYINIPEKLRLPLDISLSRRVKAMNTWNKINKAIDLGIALESVLTSPKTRDQLSLQIRLLGAKLASSEPDKRVKVYSTLKAVYNIRSSAVHNGMVDNTYKVSGEGPKSSSDILNDGIAILGECLEEIIRRGGLSAEDTDRLMIG